MKPKTDYWQFGPSTFVFDHLNPTGAYEQASGHALSQYQQTCQGIAHWQDCTAFALKQAQGLSSIDSKSPQHLVFILQQYSLDVVLDQIELKASPLIVSPINILQQGLLKHQLCFFLVHDASQLTPRLIQVDHIECSQVNTRLVSPFWQSACAQTFMQIFAEKFDVYQPLFEALTANQSLTFESFIDSLVPAYCEHTSEHTSLWPTLQAANQAFLTQAQKHQWPEPWPSIIDLILNPLACGINQRLKAPTQGGVYAIGAGQMIAILELTRHLMDRQYLPLSTPLLADNRTFGPVLELNQSGQRQALLNELWINPENRKPIAVYTAQLRSALLLRHQPKLIFLNVKTQALEAIFTDEFCQFLADLPYIPVLVMPSKAYTLSGETPYQALFKKLHTVKPALAHQLCVLGGFYAAPSILTGDLVHLTVSAKSIEAATTAAGYLCAKGPERQETTVQDGNLKLEILSGYKNTALLMAGGANKNFLTYFAARQLLKIAFNLTDASPTQSLDQVKIAIEYYRQCNISNSLELAQQLTQLYLAKPVTPPGLSEDFIHCLPLSSQGIAAIVDQTYRAQRHILRAAKTERSSLAQTRLDELVDYIRRDPQRLLGTRNARDGFIDELIAYFYATWVHHKERIPLTHDAAAFYHRFYPQQWTGDAAQEGRNAIIPVMVRASLLADVQHNAWCDVLDDVWSLYFSLNQPIQSSPTSIGFKRWHQHLFRLFAWVKEHNDSNPERCASHLLEWCQATRAQNLDQHPTILAQLELGLTRKDNCAALVFTLHLPV